MPTQETPAKPAAASKAKDGKFYAVCVERDFAFRAAQPTDDWNGKLVFPRGKPVEIDGKFRKLVEYYVPSRLQIIPDNNVPAWQKKQEAAAAAKKAAEK